MHGPREQNCAAMLRRLAIPSLTIVFACSSPPSRTFLSRDDLLEPTACQGCHQDHYEEWAGSMHAYAADDPVFIAMNRRGQRETHGALGTFCVNCHAPMAVREGATKDGLNLARLPKKLKGVTCYFCHSVDQVNGTHNNPLHLADDGVMRGGIADPFRSGRFHDAAYSSLLDRNRAESARACGACHDIVTPHEGAIERTFREWQSSVFSTSGGSTCGQCHMAQSTTPRAIAQIPDAPLRRPHSHTFAAIDVAVVPFPDVERQRQLVQSLLDTTLQTALCVEPLGAASRIRVILDNVAAGHSFPSGSAQDRRSWVEIVAYSGGKVIYSSGVVPAGASPTELADRDLWLLRDCIFDASGAQVSMFWQAASSEGNSLPPLITFDASDSRYYEAHKVKAYPASGELPTTPDHVTLRVQLQPIGLDVLDDLIATGDLDPSVRAASSTFTVGPALEWTQATATHVYIDHQTGNRVYCATNTNLNVLADKFPAAVRSRCAP